MTSRSGTDPASRSRLIAETAVIGSKCLCPVRVDVVKPNQINDPGRQQVFGVFGGDIAATNNDSLHSWPPAQFSSIL
jgi:hypothetical protein